MTEPVLALSFASPWLLSSMLIVIVPLLLALWRRQRSQPMDWSANFLLRRAISRQSASSKFQNWLLLLLRCLAVLLIALAVSRPFFGQQTPEQIDANSDRTMHVIAIDTSYSMQRKSSDAEHDDLLSHARQLAVATCTSVGTGGRFLVLSNESGEQGGRNRSVYESVDLNQAIQQIGDLRVSNHSIPFGESLRRILSDVTEVDTAGEFDEIQLVGISDFDNTAFGSVSETDVEFWLEQQTVKTRLQLLPVDGNTQQSSQSIAIDPAPNVAVGDLRLGKSIPQLGTSVELFCRVDHTFGTEPWDGTVTLEVDGRGVASQNVTLEPTQSSQLRWEWVPTNEGPAAISVRTNDGQMEMDDARYLVVSVEKSIDVLIIESTPESGRYVELALTTDGAKSPLSVRRVAVGEADRLLRGRADNFDVIVLVDVASTTPLDGLKRQLLEGAHAVVWAGAETDAQQFNKVSEELATVEPTTQLNVDTLDTAQIRRPLVLTSPSAQGVYAIDPLQYRSPAVFEFADDPESGLLSTPVFRYWHVAETELIADSSIDLRLRNGDPLLLHSHCGTSRIYWVLTSATVAPTGDDREPWNAMAAWPSFLPLNQQMLRSLINDTTASHRLVGDPIDIRSSVPTVSVTLPDGTNRQIIGQAFEANAFQTTAVEQFVAIVDTTEPGFYRFDDSSAAQLDYRNVDATESYVGQSQASRFGTWIGNQPLEPPAVTNANLQSSSPERGISLPRWLLIFAIALLVAESIIVGRRIRGLAPISK